MIIEIHNPPRQTASATPQEGNFQDGSLSILHCRLSIRTIHPVLISASLNDRLPHIRWRGFHRDVMAIFVLCAKIVVSLYSKTVELLLFVMKYVAKTDRRTEM